MTSEVSNVSKMGEICCLFGYANTKKKMFDSMRAMQNRQYDDKFVYIWRIKLCRKNTNSMICCCFGIRWDENTYIFSSNRKKWKKRRNRKCQPNSMLRWCRSFHYIIRQQFFFTLVCWYSNRRFSVYVYEYSRWDIVSVRMCARLTNSPRAHRHTNTQRHGIIAERMVRVWHTHAIRSAYVHSTCKWYSANGSNRNRN